MAQLFSELMAESRRYRIEHPWREWMWSQWYRVERAFSWSAWRYRFRRAVGFFVRGRRGWANHDVWGFDHYLAGVMAGGLRRLADHHHGPPVDFLPDWRTRWEHTDEESAAAAAAWTAWLLDKAEWFDWYHKEEDGISDDKGWIADGLPDDERHRRIEAYQAKQKRFHEEVLPDFVKRWGSLWD